MKIDLSNLSFFNRTASRLEAHLVYKHTKKPNLLISNAHLYSQFYGKSNFTVTPQDGKRH